MINIVGTIGIEATAQAVREGLEATGASVDLYIDSPGGDVIESNGISLAIAEYALAHPEKQYTCTVGTLCASASANILAKLPTAFKIKAYKDTLIMYHSCSGVFEGNPQQLKDFSVMMEIVNEAVIRELSTKTTLKIEDIKSAFASGREMWLDGRKAVECGLVDELIDAQPQEITFESASSTRQVLALVAEYKHKHLEANKMDEEKETTVEATAEEVKPETTELEKEEIKEEVAEELEEKPEVEEIDWEAKATALEAECGELKKELEALKALVAKYTPTATPTASKTVKADWLGMVRELNARHLPEQEYAKEYKALKDAHLPEFKAFMESRTIR